MLKIYIPSDLICSVDKKLLFMLVRPFYSDDGWIFNEKQLFRWGLAPDSIKLVLNVSEADIILFPYSINYYHDNGLLNYLEEYNKLCENNNNKAFAFISGDSGQSFPEYDNIIYFRMGGSRSQLSKRNLGFPAALSDHHLRLYGTKEINIREKNNKPTIGFCGHANSSQSKRMMESCKYIIENIKRFVNDPKRKDYELIFPSGYHRYQILQSLEKADEITKFFIYRKKYRWGYYVNSDLTESTLEYYNNIRESDYILCLRGGGNYSIRFYETLLMGRIPIFINTDCILPLKNQINWKKHVVWIEWEERHQIAEIVAKFHNDISCDDFRQIQLNNRKLWLEKLQPAYMLTQCLQ